MKKISIIVLIALSLGLVSCHPKIKEHTNDKNEKLLFSTLYIQQAAEYKALCYQAYNLGQVRLDAILKNHKGNKKLAIVVDVDETVLNNSPFEAKSILEKTSYPTFWKEWCEQIDAESIAGAQEFLSYAASHKVETFYVTNRKIELYDATLQNLRKNGFPYADTTHLLLRTTTSDKEERRSLIRENYDIVLFFGDALGDFSSLFDNSSTADRYTQVEEMKDLFGDKFIVLPNPMYGAWDAAMYFGIENPNKDSIYKARLKSF